MMRDAVLIVSWTLMAWVVAALVVTRCVPPPLY